MVVKSQIKLIKSLQQKKYRTKHGLFVAEGIKLVGELLNSHLQLESLYTTKPELFHGQGVSITAVSEKELSRMSGLSTPNVVLAVFKIPPSDTISYNNWVVALDRVSDPGNLGTIIRLCDWFGIEHLLCTPDTVDCFNPKVLQASMGSIGRVNVVYSTISEHVDHFKGNVYGAFMEGRDMYQTEFTEKGILIMGSESHGISDAVTAEIDIKVGIPQFGTKAAESLNVATATAILLSEIRRSSVPIQK